MLKTPLKPVRFSPYKRLPETTNKIPCYLWSVRSLLYSNATLLGLPIAMFHNNVVKGILQNWGVDKVSVPKCKVHVSESWWISMQFQVRLWEFLGCNRNTKVQLDLLCFICTSQWLADEHTWTQRTTQFTFDVVDVVFYSRVMRATAKASQIGASCTDFPQKFLDWTKEVWQQYSFVDKYWKANLCLALYIFC